MHGKDAVRVGALVVAVRLLFLRVVVADFFDGIDPRQAESGGEQSRQRGYRQQLRTWRGAHSINRNLSV